MHSSERPLEWELEVPEPAILAIVDAHVWNRLSKTGRTFPQSLCCKWGEEARGRYGGDSAARERFIKEGEDEYESEHYSGESEQELWDMLFINCATKEGATPLLRQPIKRDWVKRINEVIQHTINPRPISKLPHRSYSLDEFEARGRIH